jgi:type II secretory ATPase GspE/PulE/Tfp pilus assembly ATPase PilB-like protein
MVLPLLADASSVVGNSLPVVLADITGGGYVSIFKTIVLLVILFVWARLLSWADKDAPNAHLPRYHLNIGNTCGLALAYALVFMLPMSFWLITPIVLAIMGAEVAVYLHLRNKVVGLKDLKKQWEDWKKGIKPKKKSDAPGAVNLIAKAGPLPVPAGESPDRIPYDAIQAALTDPLRKGAEQIDMTPAGPEGGVGVKYLIDCVSYASPTVLDPATGPAAIAYIKSAAGLDVNERRKPQKGKLKLSIDNDKREAELQSAGTTAGEYLRMILAVGKRHSRKLPELGFSPAQLATVKQVIGEKGGIVLLATPKGQGLTQLMYGMIRGHDAFMEHMQSVERDPPETIEGVTANPLPASASPDEEHKKVDWVTSQHPDVILVDKVENPQTAATLIRFASPEDDEPGKRVYIGMRASTGAEAREQWRKLAGNDPRAMDVIRAVITGRVLRNLCGACKESYQPDPNTLRKLNMNPEKVTTLYKARETPLRDPKGNPIPCDFCKDLRFKGRQGVFEVMLMTDELRTAIAADISAGGKLGSNFKAAFRKGRGRYLQEEALALVEQGTTSVQEVLRVLKPADDTAAAPAARPAAAQAAAPRAGPPRAPVAQGRQASS